MRLYMWLLLWMVESEKHKVSLEKDTFSKILMRYMYWLFFTGLTEMVIFVCKIKPFYIVTEMHLSLYG